MRVCCVAAIALVSAGPILAQDTTQLSSRPDSSRQRPFRDPPTAAVLGTLVPGAGHMYSAEYGRGFGILGATWSLITAGELISITDRCMFAFFNPEPCDPGPRWQARTVGTILIAGGVGTWIAGAFDAPRAARRANERHRLRTSQWAPLVAPCFDSRAGINLGVSVSW